jgi:hypothetical protein
VLQVKPIPLPVLIVNHKCNGVEIYNVQAN